MTINELISTVKNSLNVHSDDTDKSDEYYYNLIRLYRARLLREQSMKYRPISRFNYQKLCVELECVSDADCIDCSKDISCNVLRSKKKLPSSVQARNTNLLKVRLLNGEEISPANNYTDFKSWKYSKTKKNKIGYSIIDGYLMVYGTELLKYIIVEAVFNDPTELTDFTTCGGSNTESCYDLRSDNFPIDDSMFQTILDMIMNTMLRTTQFSEDNVNDSNQRKQTEI